MPIPDENENEDEFARYVDPPMDEFFEQWSNVAYIEDEFTHGKALDASWRMTSMSAN